MAEATNQTAAAAAAARPFVEHLPHQAHAGEVEEYQVPPNERGRLIAHRD